MLNFTVGPVASPEEVCEIGADQVPYFRTSEFSEVMLENEKMMLKFSKASKSSRAVFLTGSGTAAMEASIINCLSTQDKVIVINGGSFGHRFVELLSLYKIPFSEINLSMGKSLKKEHLRNFENQGYTAFVVNLHETSSGVLYDIDLISDFCKRNHLFLLVDSISSFLADKFDMEQLGVDVMITGSQKALACQPGVSILVLSAKAIDRINNNNISCMYFNLKEALKNGERGQTPFTPAVGILRQINRRLKDIDLSGGVESEINKISLLATDFRNKLVGLPFEIVSESLSNAVTPLHPTTASAYDIFLLLKNEYGIWVCPNGGEMKDYLFRVGHLGALTTDNNSELINAFKDLQSRKLI